MEKPRKTRRGVLLFISVFIIAGAGLAYQLIAGTMASYLLGNSVTQFSFATGWFLAAMGLGSWLSRNTRRYLVETFVLVQGGLALVGGYSAAIMFFAFAWTETLYPVFLSLALSIGTLIGLEIPIILRMVTEFRISRIAISDVFTLDYLGALLASLLFPLLILPELGLIRTALFFGTMNLLCAWLSWQMIDSARKRPVALLLGLVSVLLLSGFIFSERLTHWIEDHLYQDPIVLSETTPYQRIVLTRWNDDTRLYLDGNLQFSSRDEARYHESITHVPVALSAQDPHKALVLGGGDGMVARELLKYNSIQDILMIELDPRMVEIFKEHQALRKLNGNSLASKKLRVLNLDAFRYLKSKTDTETFDLIIADLPDPNNFSLGKLYTVTFYLHLFRRLKPGGVFITQATSPLYAPDAFWSIYDTIQESDRIFNRGRKRFKLRPYHVYVPSFGDWGFIIVGKSLTSPEKMRPFKTDNKYINPAVARSLFVFAPDFKPRRRNLINRLNNQVLVNVYDRAWDNWFE